MKIIVYSDLHLYNHHRLLVNSETALNFLDFLKGYALANQIDSIVCAGDFFHTKARVYAPHVIQGLLRIKAMHKSGLKQYMIVGNHDMANPNNTMNSILFTFSDYAKIIPDYTYLDLGNTRLHLLSYSSKMFENFIPAEDKKNVLVAHLDIIGFLMPNGFRANSGFKSDDFKSFDLVISGHYHKFQQKENIVYVGSPYQTSFAEREQQHGFIVLDVDNLKWEFVEYPEAPKYKSLDLVKVEDLKKEEVKGNFLKVKLLTDKIDKSRLRNLLFEMGAASIDIIPLEDVKEIEKYYDKALGSDPKEVASAYLQSLSHLPLNKQNLLTCFNKIEEVSANITDYEV